MNRVSKKMGILVWALCMASGAAMAQHSDAERKADAARHRAMADAHEAAAKCLESGQSEKVCAAELTKACKGLAIGKYCGMRHAH